jgi:hypothetical protein
LSKNNGHEERPLPKVAFDPLRRSAALTASP